MSSVKKAFVLNYIIFFLEVAACLWMMCGTKINSFSDINLNALKFFTVDSNILMGIAALLVAVKQNKMLKGTEKDTSLNLKILKFAATVSVTITFLITVFFLYPTTIDKYGPYMLFERSNFLFHLACPILSIVVFVKYEKSELLQFKHSFKAMLPALLYTVYYTLITLSHTENGIIEEGFDWYGFFFLGFPESYFITFPALLAFMFLVAAILRRLNRAGNF